MERVKRYAYIATSNPARAIVTRQVEGVNKYRKAYRNWISVLWAVYRNKPRIELKLRNGLKLEGSPSGPIRCQGLLTWVAT